MKCFNHNAADAVAVCTYCGRALCTACIPFPTASRVVCSSECQAGLERNERAMQQLLEKSTQSARASAFYYYLCGGLLAGAAVAAWFMLPSPFLIISPPGARSCVLPPASGTGAARLTPQARGWMMEDGGWKNPILQTHTKFAQAATTLENSSTDGHR